MKNCLWCKEPIPQGRLCKSRYNAMSCHAGSCASSYMWNKCAFDEIKELPKRYCPYCNELLIRREGEVLQAWRKRIFCNKSHKALYSNKLVKPDYSHKEIAIQKAGVKVYQRDSEEFRQIAALYL